MMKKRLISTLTAVFISLALTASTNYTRPIGLHAIENGSIYSIYQDNLGALWMNTNYGICRYNGNSLEFIHDPISVSTIIGNNEDRFYIPAVTCILEFTSRSMIPTRHTPQGIDLKQSVYFAEGDSLWIGFGNNIYIYRKESTKLRGSIPVRAGTITSVSRSSNSALLIGTSADGLYQMEEDGTSIKVYDTDDAICSIFNNSHGNILIGLKEKGIICIDSEYNHMWAHTSPDNTSEIHPIRNARTFCEDADGKIYVGTMDGLFTITDDGKCHSESSYTPEGHSICSLLRDRTGNIWIGTFYSGAYICEVENSPFKSVTPPSDVSIRLINAMTEDKRGDIWLATDHYGVFRIDKSSGKYFRLANTVNKKLKTAWYDRANDVLWFGDYFGYLYRYDIQNRTWKSYIFSIPGHNPQEYSIYDIVETNGIMYIGTNKGVYTFNPEMESNISAHLKGYDDMVYTMKFDNKGKLWIGGIGLWTYMESEGMCNIDCLGHQLCAGIDIDDNNNAYIATIGHGVIYISATSVERLNNSNTGLADNYSYLVKHMGDGNLLIGTRTGLSIMSIANRKTLNYSTLNGLCLSSAREGQILERSNGEIWIGGTDGIVIMKPGKINFPEYEYPPVLDRLYINNKIVLDLNGDSLPFLKSLKLNHNQRNIAFEIASFNYSGITPVLYEYKMHGLDQQWTQFTPEDQVVYTNISPGKYRFEIRSTANLYRPEYTSVSLDIKVSPVWYASVPAIIIYILIFIGGFIYILNATYSQLLLSQQLKDKEKDNQDRIRFFINLSHELRTPLTLVSAQLELLLRNPQNAHLSKDLHNTWNNTQKMQEIVSNLLDFEKQNQGYSNLTVDDYDLCQFLIESKESFAQYANYRNISLTLKLPTTKIPIVMDAVQMQKVIYNLLLNAFKFTPDGGEIEICVRISRRGKGSFESVVSISDTGCGISEQALEKIFNPFYQEKKNKGNIRNTQGTGIGLALCKGIIDLHHGRISAENNCKGGATFTIILPMGDKWYKDDERIFRANCDMTIERYAAAVPQEEGAKKEASATDRYKMLIIEDDFQMRGLLVSIFEDDYEITEASDGAEGIEKASGIQPDIIISDVQMPVMDGLSLCSKLRQDFSTCHIPIILLTAHTSVANNIDGMNVGADEFIPKPFSVDLLEAKCHNLLENRRILRKKFSQTLDSIESITKTDKDADFLNAIIMVIEDHILESEIDVPFLCEQMHVSKSLLTRKLKGITGHSPREFIENIRMKHAARMLCDGVHNISEVSYELGFSSPKYFTIRFKKIFGMTPSQYIEDKEH